MFCTQDHELHIKKMFPGVLKQKSLICGLPFERWLTLQSRPLVVRCCYWSTSWAYFQYQMILPTSCSLYICILWLVLDFFSILFFFNLWYWSRILPTIMTSLSPAQTPIVMSFNRSLSRSVYLMPAHYAFCHVKSLWIELLRWSQILEKLAQETDVSLRWC